jgi:integrase
MPNKMILTEPRVKALKPPETGRKYIYDAKTAGLAVCVTASGSKTWYVYRWAAGRPVRIRLGKYPDLSVETARKAATEAIGQLASGRDLVAERNAKRQEPTLADLWGQYLELHAKPRKKTWKDDERQFNKYLAGLKAKRLSAITKAIVAKWHGDIAKDHGPVQANRSKALLATMFSKASDAVGYSGRNPCLGVANFPERSRERFLLPTEMQAFFSALAAEEPYWQAFFLLCLFTGSRRGNVASMEWAELDLQNAVWHIPGVKTKNKRPTTIALCAPALAILKTRFEQRNGSPYIFPAFKGDGHVIDPRKAWDRVLGAAGIKDLHMHDLRRTQGSWQAAMGISMAIIGKTLGHADLKSTQVYARLQLDPVKDAVGKTATAFLDAAKVDMRDDGTVKTREEGGDNGTQAEE